MRIFTALILCLELCLLTGCNTARKGAQAQAARIAASNSVNEVSMSTATGKVDRVTRLLLQMKGQKDITGLVNEFITIGRPAVPGLIKLIKTGTRIERTNALYVLTKMKKYSAEAIPVIEKILDEKNADRVHIAIDLLTLDPGSEKARSVLAGEMKSGDSSTRIIIARTLSLTPDDERNLPVLLDSVTDPDDEVRLAVVQSLGEMGLKNKSAAEKMIPALSNALHDQSEGVCIQAARSLGLIGPTAKSAVPLLLKMKTDDKRDKVRLAVSNALRLINVEKPKPKPAKGKDSRMLPKGLR